MILKAFKTGLIATLAIAAVVAISYGYTIIYKNNFWWAVVIAVPCFMLCVRIILNELSESLDNTKGSTNNNSTF